MIKLLETSMAAVVETWIGELVKLKEKVKVKTQKPLFSKAKEEAVEEKEGATKEARMVQRENMLSETTVFLLMDRFAPWWGCSWFMKVWYAKERLLAKDEKN